MIIKKRVFKKKKKKTLLYKSSCRTEEMQMLAYKAEERYTKLLMIVLKRIEELQKLSFDDYEVVIEVANIKGYEVVYSKNEDDMSIMLDLLFVIEEWQWMRFVKLNDNHDFVFSDHLLSLLQSAIDLILVDFLFSSFIVSYSLFGICSTQYSLPCCCLSSITFCNFIYLVIDGNDSFFCLIIQPLLKLDSFWFGVILL
jgi:hypothetical protein